ncbi:hypothetical protein N665_0178s0009 [Sinapis alba]|nr:hypothetical protein N665_0178s0009 [Sinapis alba]
MDLVLPKRIFERGHEPQVDKIKTLFLKNLETLFLEEYAKVKSDPLFTHIMALNDKKFHAVTSLKCSKEVNFDFEKWEDDIVLMAKDEKINISHKNIKLSYDALVELIITSRKKLKNKTSYLLDGFTYFFQIWIMEAIPDFGEMLGKKKDKEFVGPRCGNWRGAAKISYIKIIQLEPLFGYHCTLYPSISASKYEGVLLDVTFLRNDELTDERDGDIDIELSDEDITDGFDAVKTAPAGGESSVIGLKRARSKVVGHGAETRKTKLFMKSFLEGLIHFSFTALEEKMEKKRESEVQASLSALEEKMGKKMESEIKLLKEAMERGNGQSSKSKEPANSKAKDEKANFKSLRDVKISQMPDIELELNTQEYIKKMDQLS